MAKSRLVMTLKDSQDSMVRRAGVVTRTGRKWSTSQAVTQAESRLRHKDIVGTTAVGTQGFGTGEVRRWNSADSKTRRDMVQEEIWQTEEEERKTRAAGMGAQGSWTNWQTTERKLTWTDIWRSEPYRISFLLRSVYDLLPSPANLHRWGKIDDPKCTLCGGTGTMAHVLSGCQTCLTQGRYRWRHDQVLTELADVLEHERRKKRTGRKKERIQFVKEGQTAKKKPLTTPSILDEGEQWEMLVDLKKKLVFPNIVQTTLRPDIVIWSEKNKRLAMIELTVPWESRCEEAFERKTAKYADLLAQCRALGWHSWLFPVEVGARGFPAKSLWRLFMAFGVTGKERKRAVARMATAAERASSWLWLKREERSWKPTTDT